MKKRYIICIANSNNESDKQFMNYITENNLEWWHWIDNVWLISDGGGMLSASLIRDKLNIFYPDENKIVFEIGQKSDRWAGFGPKNENQNMFEWIENYWEK